MWRFTTGLLVLILALYSGALFAMKHYVLFVITVLLCAWLYARLDRDLTN